jgi:adenylyltransferase/sulfurtransferase
MPTLRIPTPLRPYAAGNTEIPVQGETVLAALEDMLARYPDLRPHLFSGEGQLRPFVNLFVGEENIKDLQGVQTPVKEGDRLLIIPSIAGGKANEYALASFAC